MLIANPAMLKLSIALIVLRQLSKQRKQLSNSMNLNCYRVFQLSKAESHKFLIDSLKEYDKKQFEEALLLSVDHCTCALVFVNVMGVVKFSIAAFKTSKI